jgi:hypothetical protein
VVEGGVAPRILLTLLVLLAIPAPAGAATIAYVEDEPHFAFSAEPGETNDLLLDENDDGDLMVSDAGAPLTPGANCEAIDAHTARCSPWLVGGDVNLRVFLGDGDDQVHVGPIPAGRILTVRGTTVIDGGDGDDLLDARRAAATVLDGGPGRDELYSGVIGGSLDGGDGTEPDLLVGSKRQDIVTYAGRTTPVTVNLSDKGTDGAPGEHDVLRSVEGAVGGTQADHLTGDDRKNVLFGGPGRDVLRGLGGDDGFATGLTGLIPDPPTGSAAHDRVICGAGDDVVYGRRSTDETPRSCEGVIVRRALPDELGGSGSALLAAYPAGRRVSVFCSSEEDWEDPAVARMRCSGDMRLRDRHHRLLAVAHFRRGRGVLTSRLRFTRLGTRLAARPDGVLATVRYSGENMPTDGWRIHLRR